MENWLKNIFKTNNKLELNIIKQAIFDYRNKGKNLMFELGNKYDLNISNSEDYEKLVSRINENIPRRGKLSENWNYVFHGCECGFHNKTGQSIEVVLSNAPEFGHVDACFLLSYMQSTEKYTNEINGMNWQELQKVINKLYIKGEVENIEYKKTPYNIMPNRKKPLTHLKCWGFLLICLNTIFEGFLDGQD